MDVQRNDGSIYAMIDGWMIGEILVTYLHNKTRLVSIPLNTACKFFYLDFITTEYEEII